VAGRAVQEALLVRVRRDVLGADRVVRAQAAEFERELQVVLDAAADRDQAAERALGAGRAGVQQDPVPGRTGVDALADRGRGISTLERDRLDQQVRERVQHDVGRARELALSRRRARAQASKP
jgi:hypothetical protein